MEKYNNELDFRRIIREIKRLRWLYLLAFIVLFGAGIFYYIRSMPLYTAVGELLIEDSSENTPSAGSGGVSAIMRSFSIGGFGSSSVDNEIAIIRSNALRRRVVDKLKLNRIYVEKDGMKKIMLYDDSPVSVEASKEMFDTLSSAMTMRISIRNGLVSVKATQGRIFKKTVGELKNAALPCTFSTSCGDFQLLKTNGFSDTDVDIDVIVMGNEAAAKELSEQLYVEISDAKTDVVSMTYSSPNRKKAISVVNSVMNEYNKMRIERRHANAAKEIDYFKARLMVISSSLADSEINLEKFKKDHKLMGVDQEAGLLVGGTVGKKEELVKLQAQIDYYKDILRSLNDGNKGDLLPIIESSKNPAIEAYNEAVMRRKNLEVSATPENKTLQVLNSQIEYLRESIKSNMELLLEQGELNISTLKQLTGTAVNRINELPELEREYVSLLRDQKFQNELYLFLLQKKESAELKYYSNSTLGFVFEQAYCDLKPKNSKGLMILCLALILSAVLPSIMAVILLMMKNKVYQPMDLRDLGMEYKSVMYTGINSQLSYFRQSLLNNESNIFLVLNYSSSNDISEKISQSFRNIEKNAFWDNSLKENDQILTKSFEAHVKELSMRHDMVFVVVPEVDAIRSIASYIEANKCGVIVLVDSGKTDRKTLKKDIEDIEPNRIYTLIIKH